MALPPYSLPWDLHPLLPDGDGTGRTLPAALQPGRLVRSDKGTGRPAFWLSDDMIDDELWDTLMADRDRTGFWPLFLFSPEADRSPWATGDVSFDNVTSPADHDPEALLREWWYRCVVPAGVDTAPFGDRWPDRPASPPPPRADPDQLAREVGSWLADDPTMSLGMVAAGSGADTVTAMGWRGAASHTDDVAQISAVLHDWERRYGTRVVEVTGCGLEMSVAAPPRDRDEAMGVAAEHFAFCPMPIWWSMGGTLASYAADLVDASTWHVAWE